MTNETLPVPAGFDLLVELERAGAATPVALFIEDANLPVERWEALVVMYGRLHTTARFGIGDLANFGVIAYGGEPADRYERIAELTGMSPQTVENWASVCRKVTRRRRRASLSFSHHEAVRRLEPDAQAEWLERAEAERWTAMTLRARLSEADALPPPPEQPGWSDEWRQRPLPAPPPSSENGASAEPPPPAVVPAPRDGGQVVISEPPSERERDLREAIELLLEQAEPLDDDAYYRVPRTRLRELARLVGE